MYPLKFNPILKSTIWGGEKIIPFKHLATEQAQVGESWEISNVPGDESVVANGTDAGKNLSDMVKATINVSEIISLCLSNSLMHAMIFPYKFTPMTNLPENATTQWERQKCGM